MSENGKWAIYAALIAAVIIAGIICLAAYESAVSSDCHAVSHTVSEYKDCMKQVTN